MVFEKVKILLAQQLDIDEDSITEDTNIVDDLGADSLDVVELMTTLEEDFGLLISDESLNELHTVGDIVKYIETLI
jgi:acyl carrier protein